MSCGHDDEPREEHEEHINHEAWVIPFADLLTLLMATFIALFAMSSVDKDKFKELSIGFNEALGGNELDTGVFAAEQGSGVVAGSGSSGDLDRSGGAVGPGSEAESDSFVKRVLEQQENIQAATAAERESLQNVEAQLQAAAEAKGYGDKLRFELKDDGLHVTIVTDRVLFASGRAEIASAGQEVLTLVADALAGVENPILIGGHTDSRPISTAAFPSNWELSAARATAVLRFVQANGLESADLLATGYADTRPIESNASEDGRAHNRRVEIVIQSRVVAALLDANGLGDGSGDGDAAAGGAGDTAPSVEDIVGDLAADA